MSETNGRKDWMQPTVILALVFGIGGAILTALGLALGDTRNGVHGLQDRELANAYERGRLDTKIDNHGDKLIKLDETLQREMRLLDAAMVSRIDELDHRLQGEIARASDVGTDDRSVLRASIAELRQYQDHFREINAKQDEWIRMNERKGNP